MSGIFSRTKSGSAGAVNGGAQTQTGDAFNIGASAGDDLNIKVRQTYNTSTTDHGAVESAFAFGDSALDYAEEMGIAAIGANQDISEMAILENSSLANSAIDTVSYSTNNALDTVLDANRLNNQSLMQALDYNQALIKEGNQTEATTIVRQLLDALPIVLVIGGVVFYAVKTKGK